VAIRHLLHSCPICGLVGGVRAGERGEACTGCGTRYRRGRGSRIRAQRARADDVVLTAAEWMQRLVDLDDLRFATGEPPPEPIALREAGDQRPVRGAQGELLGWVETFGAPRRGLLSIDRDALVFHRDDGHSLAVPLLDVTAIQASSTALLVKRRARPVLALGFVSGSLRLWEHAIRLRIRDLYRESGRGEILDFQPTICTRP